MSYDGLLETATERVGAGIYGVRWRKACEKIEHAGYGEAVSNAYAHSSLEVARLVGPDLAIGLADVVSYVAIKASCSAAEILPVVAIRVAVRLEQHEGHFSTWMHLIEQFADFAPESTLMVFEQNGLSPLKTGHYAS